jgi:hypothetical protein
MTLYSACLCSFTFHEAVLQLEPLLQGHRFATITFTSRNGSCELVFIELKLYHYPLIKASLIWSSLQASGQQVASNQTDSVSIGCMFSLSCPHSNCRKPSRDSSE